MTGWLLPRDVLLRKGVAVAGWVVHTAAALGQLWGCRAWTGMGAPPQITCCISQLSGHPGPALPGACGRTETFLGADAQALLSAAVPSCQDGLFWATRPSCVSGNGRDAFHGHQALCPQVQGRPDPFPLFLDLDCGCSWFLETHRIAKAEWDACWLGGAWLYFCRIHSKTDNIHFCPTAFQPLPAAQTQQQMGGTCVSSLGAGTRGRRAPGTVAAAAPPSSGAGRQGDRP